MKKLLFIALISFSLFLNAQIEPYCVNTYVSGTHPISLVEFAGINNASTNEYIFVFGGSASGHQDFTSIEGNVIAGNSYPITIKGNTRGDFNNNVSVFCDWNRDNDFFDAGETYNIGNIVNSTGIDDVQLVGAIQIPGNVTAGNVRMREIGRAHV